MFKSPFLLNGRIARTEFGLSLIIFNIATTIIFFALLLDFGFAFRFFLIMLFFGVAWFRVAQGTKRCHDIDISGWYQLIPFYTIVLLFQKGKTEPNKYGVSPKVVVVDEVCKIVSIGSEYVRAELSNGKVTILENITLPKYARKGDLIKHVGNGFYIVVDEQENLLFRM
jgi:uncharacterized membrane protein YhaH (DUF805 family)